MKKLLALALLLLGGAAHAQGTGQLGSGQVWGNSSASQAIASPTNLWALINRNCSTPGTGSIPFMGAANLSCVVPGSTTQVLHGGTAPAFSAVALGTDVSGTLGAAQFPALTGDVTTSAGSLTTTLATVNANVGTFGSTTNCVTYTVNGKGLVTASSQGTCAPAIGSVTGLGTGVATALGVNVGSSGAFAQLIASGALALSTSAIASAACTTAQTATATGTLTTDAIIASFNGDPTAVTGYIPLTSGMLTIIPYPTANTVNFKVCNNTAASITPGAVTINWRVVR
jgi:hypothetical protein